MSQRSDDGIFKFLSGLFIGWLAGYVLGKLTADRPGKEVYKDLELNSTEFVHNLRDRLDDIKGQASDRFRDLKSFTDEGFKTSAQNIQDKVIELGKQLDELTSRSEHNNSSKGGEKEELNK